MGAGAGDSVSDPTSQLVETALAGDVDALRRLVEAITPAIQTAVADTVRRHLKGLARTSSRREVEDLVQEVLVALLAKDGKRLRQWSAERGSLSAYVKLVSRCVVYSILRTQKLNPWANDTMSPEDIDDLVSDEDDPEHQAAQSEYQAAVLAGLEARLTDHTRVVFRLLVEGQSTGAICEGTGMSENAVHLIRHRIVATARDVARKLLGDPGDA